MKNIRLFRTKKEYEDFVFGEVFTELLIRDNPFYRNLIQLIIDSKAPVFYYQSDESEHANFSGYYNFELIRETYENKTLRSMYFLHDFTHLLFYYPYDMTSVSEEEFSDAVTLAEYTASNETEIFIHYRIPELREKVFQDRRIFFDILKERETPQPPIQAMFQVRKIIIETDSLDSLFFTKPEDAQIRDTFKSYTGSNSWCKERYQASIKLKNPHEYSYKFFTPLNYERTITVYQSTAGEAEYQRNILLNIRLLCMILGMENPPETFEEFFEKLPLLEGKIMFPKK